jgi:hypothetical protein
MVRQGTPKCRGFFLQAAGIGKHQFRAGEQAEHFQITLRRQQDDARTGQELAKAEAIDVGARAGMQGKDQRQLLGNLAQHAQQGRQLLGPVDIRRAVQRHHAITPRIVENRRIDTGHLQRLRRGMGELAIRQQGIDHHVADKTHAFLGDPFARQVGLGAALGGIQAVGDLVGEDAVDLLRHRPVVAAQAGFDMHHRHFLLGADQRTGQRRIHVADDQHAGRPLCIDYRLETPHHFRGLHRVRCRTHLEIDVRMRQTQVHEQAIVHVPVVVLTSMHEQRRQCRMVGAERAQNRCHFHEIGARTDDTDHRTQISGP